MLKWNHRSQFTVMILGIAAASLCLDQLNTKNAFAQQATAVSSVRPRSGGAEPSQAAGTTAAQESGSAKTTHPLDPALRMAYTSLQHIQENVNDYTALFVKRTRIDGELTPLQYAKVKIRNPKTSDGQATVPMGVYLHFLKPDSVKGREVIWVQGKNDGKLIAHEGGLLNMLSVSLDPNGYMAMRGQRHPITEIGTQNLVKSVIETGMRDRQHGECEVQFFQNAKVGQSQCTMLQVIHPVKRPHFDFYCARVYFCDSLKMPVRYEAYSWPLTDGGAPVLEEEYTYLNVNVNVGLSDLDFDTENPAYGF